MYKIEKGIAITDHNRKSKYPFKEMKVNDSFFIPCEKEKLNNKRTSLLSSCRNMKQKFITRAVDGGIRIWRVS